MIAAAQDEKVTGDRKTQPFYWQQNGQASGQSPSCGKLAACRTAGSDRVIRSDD